MNGDATLHRGGPYEPGCVAHETFVGRTEVLDWIVERVTTGSLALGVQAGRRMGKSSVLRAIETRLRGLGGGLRVVPVRVCLGEEPPKDEDDLLRRIVEEALSGMDWSPDEQGAPSVRLQNPHLKTMALRLKAKRNAVVVIMFDDLHKLLTASWCHGFLGRWNYLLRNEAATRRQLCLIVTGDRRVRDALGRDVAGSPLPVDDWGRLTLLGRSELVELLGKHSAFPCDEVAVAGVERLSAGHPYLAQVLLHRACEAGSRDSVTFIEALGEAARSREVIDAKAALFASLLEDLDAPAKLMLERLATSDLDRAAREQLVGPLQSRAAAELLESEGLARLDAQGGLRLAEPWRELIPAAVMSVRPPAFGALVRVQLGRDGARRWFQVLEEVAGPVTASREYSPWVPIRGAAAGLEKELAKPLCKGDARRLGLSARALLTLIPAGAQWLVACPPRSHVLLSIDEHDEAADFAWEAMESTGGLPFGVTHSLGRCLCLGAPSPTPSAPVRRQASDRIAVLCGPGVSTSDCEVDGIRAAAGRAGLRVDIFDGTGRLVRDVKEFLVGGCRILHVVAHGSSTGGLYGGLQVVGIAMQAREFQAALAESPPELAFLNCCESVRDLGSGGSPALALMRMGSIVVGTLHGPETNAASMVAVEFYRRLCAGDCAGEAMKQARSKCRNGADSLSWATYVLYGDPRWTLR
jgi:hypothetical protein